MKTTYKKVVEYAKMIGIGVAMLAGAALFWFIVIEFMWACYYAGIPM